MKESKDSLKSGDAGIYAIGLAAFWLLAFLCLVIGEGREWAGAFMLMMLLPGLGLYVLAKGGNP